MADDFSDEYVAETLKQDAKNSSIRYSALGFLPKSRPVSAPKANTRFLRNIIRDTDSHNAALKAKERQVELSRTENRGGSTQRNSRSLSSDLRHRREDREDNGHRHRSHRHRSSRKRSRSESPSRRRSRSPRSRNSHRSDRRGSRPLNSMVSPESKHKGYRHHSREAIERKNRSSAHKHGKATGESSDQRTRETSSGSKSADRSRRQEPRVVGEHKTSQDSSSDHIRKECNSARTAVSESTSDSDPLDAIIGPRPSRNSQHVHSRGRGILNGSSSTMDKHFSATYDPQADIIQNEESDDDWSDAIEGFRYRQKIMQKSADRLREAGFDDLSVKVKSVWKDRDNLDDTDVRWGKRGEDRAWDRGKVVDSEGNFDLQTKPEWGRLKDT